MLTLTDDAIQAKQTSGTDSWKLLNELMDYQFETKEMDSHVSEKTEMNNHSA